MWKSFVSKAWNQGRGANVPDMDLIKSTIKFGIKIMRLKKVVIIAVISFLLLVVLSAAISLFSVARIYSEEIVTEDIPIPDYLIEGSMQAVSEWEETFPPDQLKQIKELGVDVSPGLVEAVQLLTDIPMDEVMGIVATTDIIFEDKPIITRVSSSIGEFSESVEYRSYLVSARMYNGTHVFLYENHIEVSTTTTTTTVTDENGERHTIEVTVTTETITPVIAGEKWDKDYRKFHDFLSHRGYRKEEERLMVYGLAMKLDPSFYDAEASPLFVELFGGQGKKNVQKPLPPEEIIAALKEAISITGVDEETWLPDLMQLVMRESGGRPDAFNETPVFYSAKWGYQNAHGLLQLMPPTFLAHKVPGYDDIWNPVDNAAAAINYIIGRYGHVSNIPGLYEANYKGY